MNDDNELIKLGGGNTIAKREIVVIAQPNTAAIKRLITTYKGKDKVIDLSRGQRTRSVIFTASGYLVLSSLRAKTVAERFLGRFRLESQDSTD